MSRQPVSPRQGPCERPSFCGRIWRRRCGTLTLRVAALAAAALALSSFQREGTQALAQDPLIVETHRIRLANEPGGRVEISLDGGRIWESIGKVSRPASVTGVGGRALEAVLPATIAGTAPEAVTIRVPTTVATPRWLKIAAAREAPNNAAVQTDIPAGDSLFRALAPLPGSRVYVEKDARRDLLPTNYMPRRGDRLVVVCERSPDTPTAVVIENKAGGAVMMVTPLGEEKVIGKVRQPLKGIGRYAGTERVGQGHIVAFQGATVLVSTSGTARKLDAKNDPLEEKGGFVIQPAESELRGATHPDSQILIEAAAEEGRRKPVVSPFFGLPIPISSTVPTDPSPTRVEVRIDGGDWEPVPDLRGGTDAAELPAKLASALTAGRAPKEGITHLRIVPGVPSLATYRHFVRLAVASKVGEGVQRGRISITANTVGVGIAFVSFYVDGTLAKVTNQSPFIWEWDTTRVPNGPHLVEIRGADEKGTVVNSVLRKVLVDN